MSRVTPFTGVWIEILSPAFTPQLVQVSLPSRECGLKLAYMAAHHGAAHVTPFTGVWIEICNVRR